MQSLLQSPVAPTHGSGPLSDRLGSESRNVPQRLSQAGESQAEPRPDTRKAPARALRIPLRELLTPAPSLHGVRFRLLKKVKSRSQILADVGRLLRDYAALEHITGER